MYSTKRRIAERESNRIARRRCIFASFGVLSLARLISCFAKSHQNLSKMHSPAGASSFDAADLFESKSFSRRAYRQYVQGERCRNRRNLHVKTNLVRLPFGYALYYSFIIYHIFSFVKACASILHPIHKKRQIIRVFEVYS